MTHDVLVEVEGLYRYYGPHCAVRDVSFTLRKGEVLGFLGPNGAGKSTTMHMIAGCLAPSAGRIRIAGLDLLDEPEAAKARIGYLPEQPPVYPELTVDEYLDYCARLKGIPRSRRRTARDEAKARCGLADSGRRLIGNLSKGYQQRVGIAQAILHAPAVVILDEPTVGLDPIQIREIRTLIAELGREHGVILSTHILPEVQAVCSRVQIIHKGRLVFSDAVTALATRQSSDATVVGLRRPPAAETLAALPGITAAEPLGEGRFRLRHADGAEPGERIAERAAAEGWGLFELAPERKSLEQIFVELTTADEVVEKEAA
ncbi:MAG TPA: ATP-binding cassette domain-containing protein [Gammaproteobacteria bacterium]|nr:ATP-binding cassette domain-containing protein [Gammaproteobacteria bacterium]